MIGLRWAFRLMLACGAVGMAGCDRTSSHLDALPRPLGTADVLRFEVASAGDGLGLDEQAWRAVESAIDDGQQRWGRWVRNRWTPFVEDVWFRESQPWKDDPDQAKAFVERAKNLRREAAALDDELVANVLLLTSNDDAAERFRAMRRLERAGQLLAGYSRSGRMPTLPEAGLARAGLTKEAGAKVQRALGRSIVDRAKLLEEVAALRFELDLLAMGEENEERRAVLADAVARFREAIAALDEANDLAVSSAAEGLELEDRGRIETQWLRSSADPDGDRRELADMAFEAVARSRRLRPADSQKVREAHAAWEIEDMKILEEFEDLRNQRSRALRDRAARKAVERQIRDLRQRRLTIYSNAFNAMGAFAPEELLGDVRDLVRDLPDAETLRMRLAAIAGRADGDAVFEMVPPEMIPEPEDDAPDRLIGSEPMANLVADPMPGSVVRRIFNRAARDLFDVAMELHDAYLASYMAMVEEAQPGIEQAEDAINESGRGGAEVDPLEAMRRFRIAVGRMVDLADSLRISLNELDEIFFQDLQAIVGAELESELVLEHQRRQREVLDVTIDDDGPFGVAVDSPPGLEMAEVIWMADLGGSGRQAAEEVLRDMHPQLHDVRIRHRAASITAIIEIFAAFGERSMMGESFDVREGAEVVERVMRNGIDEAQVVHEEFLDRLSQRLDPDDMTRVRRAWILASYPELEFRFAPGLRSRPAEGLGRLIDRGRIGDRALEPAEIVVLDAMLDEWMADSDALLEQAYTLRGRTLINDLVESPEQWRNILRRHPEWVILDERRRETDARLVRRVRSLLGEAVDEEPWIQRAIAPSVRVTTWTGGML